MTTDSIGSPSLSLSEAFPDPLAARLRIIEAALFISPDPLSVEQLKQLFDPAEKVDAPAIEQLLQQLQAESETRGVILVKVAGGYRYQTRQDYQPWLLKLQEDKPRRYGRALLETLALIAYRQPITRGEIEEVRGVAVATSVMRTLLERGWIKPVGRRDIPGRPITFGTTDAFLNDFGLAHLSDLPTLAHIKSMSELEPGFDFDPEVDTDLSFGRMLEAYQTPDRSEQGDDLDDVLAASWQASDALNASFANPLNPLNSTSSDAASPEPEPSPSFHEMAMTESEMNDLIAAKVREQQFYLERQQNQHEKNDNDPEDDASGHR